MKNTEYNILGVTENGTKFLSKLFTEWVDEEHRNTCQVFTKEQIDYLIPLLELENDEFIEIGCFPTRLKWKGINNKLY